MSENVKSAEEIIKDIFQQAAEDESINKEVLNAIKGLYDKNELTKPKLKAAMSEIKEI